ncbi:MAG: hypothetical protein EXR69_11880 [Myxococcales bacterium]|nr:hypothetical protein [Myxococcales bacterium]
MSKDRTERPTGSSQAQDLLADTLSRLWNKSRSEAGHAARWAREKLTLRQLRGDRDRMYQKLGKETRHLHEAGEIAHPGVARGVERIRDLERKIADLEDQMRAVGLEPEADHGPGS